MATFSVDAPAQQQAILDYFKEHPEEAPTTGTYTVVVQAQAGAESSPIEVSLP